MKVVILAGGLGTRISEESHLKPKPMIEIGDSPILWHILKYYSSYGFNEFIICCGYKGYFIKEYFADYYLHRSDITFDFADNNNMIIHNNIAEPWKVTVVDTGLETQTGGRIKKIEKYVNNETFMLTYGDGVSDVDLTKLYEFHKKHGKAATITAIQPGGRFGVLDIDNDHQINQFAEKNKEDGGWINGGFMVLEPEIFKYLDNDMTVFEREPLENLAKENKLMAYKHTGFWKCMDTLRDKEALEYLCKMKQAPWIRW
ncbi:glucose-1-phosphate cytidylyltransferase [Clostridium sp. 2-1]|uniref:glucose-1-phosphate cytidylyltransferase n=1 Tax=Clostridium TaxID=1485 RepID=UPI000CDA8515|nr:MULTISPECIES: glucose-1-phosphate cytidylyltransferase [Clostridium]MBN7573067.1 glucose-1-phosphate cytidylyltransferase [Clostridium beijerinckii]MBN7578406.1 glucose-1-phosphate cytidylyltransferase [Clostridium beijerinckii]MBN7582841.1 glucose-1-phosphate cytidylyltransferase [Clostridium beijerinckii]MBO0519006.1 glucose-1-phosphate cytidylyltransferase [Clostridium beijerinckii]POO93271.1 glucose-1-phosphate cytidylyltransferase [Clostridium sp. 2-1]